MISDKIYLRPNSVKEALEIAQDHSDDFCFLAGGTDVMVNRFQGNETSSCIIDLTGITEWNQVKIIPDKYLSIGPLVKLDELNNFEAIRNEFPVLIEAAKSVGSPLIRKTATLGGNILCENRCIFYNQSEWWRESVGYCLKCDGSVCIATGSKKHCYSEFVSDTAPALISLDAMIEIIDEDGERLMKLEDIYSGDGTNPKILKKASLIKSILLPLNNQFRSVFKKLRLRKSLDFTSLTTAVTVNANGRLKIAVGGVDPKPVVIEGTVNSDLEELIVYVLKKSRAIDNEMFTRKYRRDMIRVFLTQSFETLL
ncbi:MAG: 4-hydroxybenzoyl-CoA reductase subunit beta [Ignavibacteria bacterium]|nr:4-hydroxybenzoyl-CoA reductase subunit beta [Ignavibacteria bacterium]